MADAASEEVPATSTSGQKGTSGLDIEAAVRHLDSHALSESTGRCARFVREALDAGKVIINPNPRNAKDYGPYLEAKGFVKLTATEEPQYTPLKGDVAVIQPYKGGSPAGHICMYNGTQWVSDFKQRDMWSGPGYRQHKPDYAIYRP
jgi:hypothetical protein